jgi:hypothetical protein
MRTKELASAYSFSRSYALHTIESPKIHSGMRAREELCVSYHRESRLMKELEAILAAVSSRTR